MSDSQVFGRMFAPTEKDFLEAVRVIILGLQKKGHTQKYIAQRLGCSAKTIHHAQEMRHNLSGWILARIRFEFGDEAVAPFDALGGGPVTRPDEGKLVETLAAIRTMADDAVRVPA
jgi:hypothetical protein